MPSVEKLLIFLASPGDVLTERRYVHRVVDELNRTVAAKQDIVLQVVSWEKDTFPGYGVDAQAIINTQIAQMAEYALFVGIMWNRLGKPTPRAESGTVEEFERAVQACEKSGQPDIWFYFRQSAARLDSHEQLDQAAKVVTFKKQVQAKGLPWTYKSPSDFRDQFRNQMILWLNARGHKETSTPADKDRLNNLNLLVQPPEPTPSSEERLNRSAPIERRYPGKQDEPSMLTTKPKNDVVESASLNTARIIVKALLYQTPHGRIEMVSLDGSSLILKRTKSELVDVVALQKLENQTIATFFEGTSVTIATPLKIWEDGNYICELHPYYKGVNLHDLIERNKYKLGGTYLGIVYDCGFRALSKLHELGLLHRDLTPDNMLMTPTGDIIILDISFCCRQEYQQPPVYNKAFSPPEQALGKAVRQSDWYSFAASIYFLANGTPPASSSSLEDLRNKIININLGSFGHRDPTHWEIIDSLLNKDVNERPSSYREILLRTGSFPRSLDIYGVLDLDAQGFLVLYPSGITIGSRVEIVRVLQERLQSATMPDELRAEVKSFLAGRNPWLIE